MVRTMRVGIYAGVIAVGVMVASVTSAYAQAAPNCRNTESFEKWRAGFKKDALEQGITPRTLARTEHLLVLDRKIIGIDRGQRVFSQAFLEFSNRMAGAGRVPRGQQLIKKHSALFAKIEEQYGVPAPVITAFWALESDFGAGIGKFEVLRSLASLAYDCRRSERFHKELIAALKIIQRGDLTPDTMIGSWAGELGQTQFLPSHYFNYGVDFDGNGKVDLLRSVPDVLATTAHYIQKIGWRRGEPWMLEVRVPQRMDWSQASLDIEHPHSQWAQWGVTLANGKPLPEDAPKASLLLPMGRLGPAFLVYPNFRVYTEWNNSLIYSTTAAYLATRIAGAPPLRKGNGTPDTFTMEQTRELQTLLVKAGYDVGGVDGKLGASSRKAVQQAQVKFKLPADGYPTDELVRRLRRGG
ncbi:MAG: lytic murein transglycosylase [Xanthobacteraceae bacterium]|nr:lytic murein transglycosylase [Xanthobacteraceae bacterium]MCW5675196.1 lytic murein transglycosylase [Xanthobacteraceae bacterium]